MSTDMNCINRFGKPTPEYRRFECDKRFLLIGGNGETHPGKDEPPSEEYLKKYPVFTEEWYKAKYAKKGDLEFDKGLIDDRGFDLTKSKEKYTLQVGEIITRYGDIGGYYASPEDEVGDYDFRSLPYFQCDCVYLVYTVIKPFEVERGYTAPWFGKPGGAIQYVFSKPIQYYSGEGKDYRTGEFLKESEVFLKRISRR